MERALKNLIRSSINLLRKCVLKFKPGMYAHFHRYPHATIPFAL